MAFLHFHNIPDPAAVRVDRINPLTGQKERVNPATGNVEPVPIVGFTLSCDASREGDPPEASGLGQRKAVQLRDRKRLEFVNPKVLTCPAGPKGDPWRKQHDFIQADEIVFKCFHDNEEHDIRYRVTRSPGIYDVDTGELLVGTERYDSTNVEVVHHFSLELVR